MSYNALLKCHNCECESVHTLHASHDTEVRIGSFVTQRRGHICGMIGRRRYLVSMPSQRENNFKH